MTTENGPGDETEGEDLSSSDPGADPLYEEDDEDLLRQDLVDVEVLKSLLGPRGIKGAVFFCPDCDDDHFLGWDLLAGNLRELLEQGESPVHEPAFDPDPEDYVSWDYARGFLDGFETFQKERIEEISVKLSDELSQLDWRVDKIKALMARVGIDDVSQDEEGSGSS